MSTNRKNTHARLNDRGEPTTTEQPTCAYRHCEETYPTINHMGEEFCSDDCALSYQMLQE